MRLALLVTVVLGLALRMLHMGALANTPFWDAPVVDEAAFERDAKALIAEGQLGHAFYRPPLYAYVRAALTLVGLGGPTALHLAHAILSTITAMLLVGLTYRLTARHSEVVRSRATWAAAVIAASYGPLVLTELELMSTAWVDALLALALLLASKASERLAYSDCAAGLCVGLATTGWGHALVFFLPVLLLRRQAVAPHKRMYLALVLALSTASAPALTALVNAREGEPGVVISANVGINLWLGNAPRFREVVAAGPGLYYDHEYQLPTRAGAISMRARERWYLAAVAEAVFADPLLALARTGEKALHLLHGGEIWRDQSLDWMRAHSAAAFLLVWDFGLKFPFGLLLPLALLGHRNSLASGAWRALTLTVAIYTISLAPFIVSMRYRTPLVLLLIPLASSACAHLSLQPRLTAASARALLHRPRAWMFVLAMVATSLPNPRGAAMAVSPAQQEIRLSRAYQRRQDAAAALSSAERAVELAPGAADAHDELGTLLLALGRPAAARVHFERAIELLPDSEGAHILHAQSLLAAGEKERARESLRRAVAINPHHVFALVELARLERTLGEPKRAAELLERSLAASYRRDSNTIYSLARLYLQLGETNRARVLLLELRKKHKEAAAVRARLRTAPFLDAN